ncbi:MAG: carbonic anhydrase, partial [Planctomycetia bacterium]|nr:carbonic anhydrase [Planctomycetia bacterium]
MVGALFAPLPNAVYSQDEPLVLVDESLDVDTTSFNNQVVPSYVNYEVTPDLAYRRLVAGNAKYLNEDSDAAKTLPDLSNDAQRFPIASILYSSDMPTLPTTLTQTTTHDVYLTSIKAGAVASEHMTAIEYGLLNLQTPLLVVMGHYPSREVSNLIRNYDALKAQAQAESNKIARSGAQTVQSNAATPEQLKLYNLIGPAIARSKEAYPDLDGYNLANVVSEALVWQSLETILMKSTVAQDLIRAGKLNVIAAIVDDQTGKIYWLGAHPLQEEFLKPTPENLQTVEDSNTILTESELPEALDDSTIQSYVQAYENDVYYNEIVNEYYTQPYYYEPSWELFSQRAWVYRPWYGVWVTPFTPWPYWQPWGAPTPGGASVGLSIWDGRLNFYIGYNRHYDRLIYYDPDYRPLDPWWGADYFRRPAPHPHDPIFDLIISGRRHDIRHEPFDAPWRRPGFPAPGAPAPAAPAPGYHPGVARPGIVISLGGIQIGVPLTDHNRDRYRPGGSAPNPGMRTPGSQPGGAPMSIPGRADRGAIVNPRQPIGARPNPGVTPGARLNPGVQPGSGARPNPGVTPGARPNPGVQPGS